MAELKSALGKLPHPLLDVPRLTECLLVGDVKMAQAQQEPFALQNADAGDAAEALAALQGSSRGPVAPQAPGAPSATTHIVPGIRVPGMGRGSSLYRGVSKASFPSCRKVLPESEVQTLQGRQGCRCLVA